MSQDQKPKVLITSQFISKEAIQMLEKFANIEIIQAKSPEEVVIKAARNVDAILARTVKITKNVIESAKNLKIISRHGVGVDGIDVEEASKRGIFVTITPDANAEAVSEFAIALMLTFSRRILDCFENIKSGGWDRGKLIQSELFGKNLGIVGLGNIGSRVAKKAKAFGMKILGFDPCISPEYEEKIGAKLVSFDELLSKSDYISVHIPAMPQTRSMFGKSEFSLMKKTAIFINTSRGEVVNEKEMIVALRNKEIAGACLDVFKEEPLYRENELLSLENVILTPHVAAQSKEAIERVGKEAAQNIIKVLRGELPKGIYNKEVLGR